MVASRRAYGIVSREAGTPPARRHCLVLSRNLWIKRTNHWMDGAPLSDTFKVAIEGSGESLPSTFRSCW